MNREEVEKRFDDFRLRCLSTSQGFVHADVKWERNVEMYFQRYVAMLTVREIAKLHGVGYGRAHSVIKKMDLIAKNPNARRFGDIAERMI
jgi:hypothetical protein